MLKRDTGLKFDTGALQTETTARLAEFVYKFVCFDGRSAKIILHDGLRVYRIDLRKYTPVSMKLLSPGSAPFKPVFSQPVPAKILPFKSTVTKPSILKQAPRGANTLFDFTAKSYNLT